MRNYIVGIITLFIIVLGLFFFGNIEQADSRDVNTIKPYSLQGRLLKADSQAENKTNSLAEQEKTISTSVADADEVGKQNGTSAVHPANNMADTKPDLIAATEQEKTNVQTIVAIGDSLTLGVGDRSNRGGYLYFLKQALSVYPTEKVDVINLGVKGNRTEYLLKRLQQNKVSGAIAKADKVIISIGGNDLMKVIKSHFMDLTFERFDEEKLNYDIRLQKILLTVREYNEECDIYLIGLFNPFSHFFEEFVELDEVVADWDHIGMKATQQIKGAAYIPISDIFKSSGEDLLYDYIHPNEKGYEKIAQRLLQNMKESEEAAFELAL